MNSNGIPSGNLNMYLQRYRMRRGLAFGVIIVAALLAFEIFNYSTTDYALADLLGDLNFLGIRWATILAIAFCGIDFAGIARLFTPEEGPNNQTEVWYLFGAWLLAATMNAMLTWWGVSLAVLNHETLGNAVIERATLLRVVPIFVAVLVWLIRVLIIGTFSVAGDRLFSQGEQSVAYTPRQAVYTPPQSVSAPQPVRSLGSSRMPVAPRAASAPSNASVSRTFRSAPKPLAENNPIEDPEMQPGPSRPEPTYHPVAAMGQPTNGQNHNGNGSPNNNPANPNGARPGTGTRQFRR